MRTARDDLHIPLAGSIATLMASPFGSRIRLAPDFETGSPSARDREVFEIEHEFDIDAAPDPRGGAEPPVVVTEADEDPSALTPSVGGEGEAEPGEDAGGDGALDATPGDATGADGEPKRGKKLSYQERINQLTKARREAEARAQQAEAVAQQQAAQLAQLQRGYEQTADVAATNYEVNLKTRQSDAQAKYKAAYESGDADALLEAHNLLTDLKVEAYRLENWKRQQQAQRAQQPAQQPVQPVQPPQAPRPSERAQRWMQENNWFGQDRAMTSEARAVHGDLLAEGYHPESEDYYDELTRRVRDTFPHRFQALASQRQPAPASRGPATVVAPASRAVPVGNKGRVTLTPSQVETARKLGVPLEAYAAELLKISGR